jgi:ADP-ribosylglycohydrolase
LSNQADYETAILDIIRCGGDTDTTAAIVGGIIAARVGRAFLNNGWTIYGNFLELSIGWENGLNA